MGWESVVYKREDRGGKCAPSTAARGEAPAGCSYLVCYRASPERTVSLAPQQLVVALDAAPRAEPLTGCTDRSGGPAVRSPTGPHPALLPISCGSRLEPDRKETANWHQRRGPT